LFVGCVVRGERRLGGDTGSQSATAVTRRYALEKCELMFLE
jgi:Mg/Co/Ni transporter MgtE